VKQAIEESFYRTATIVGLTPHTTWSTINAVSREGIGGGRVYDAAIAGCIAEAGATVVFTWNVKHFVTVAPPGLEVREP
jgi:predicted nucleic acid-binding protein